MGTMPVINLKGMSRMLYKFEWDKDIQSYAYEPKSQREADDIFLTQNKLYKTMRFSVWLEEEPEKEPCPKCEAVKPEEEAPKKRKQGRPRKNVARLKKNLQATMS